MNTEVQQQLFREISDLRVPETVLRIGQSKRVLDQEIDQAVFVRWPDGKPCIPVNMYLLEGAYTWTGRTAASYASELTFLLRYCFRTGKSFSDLADDDIFVLVSELRRESAPTDPTRPARNDNRVRVLLHRTIDFLAWFQDKAYSGPKRIVGERGECPGIVCTRKRSAKTGRTYWHHRYMPTKVSVEPKLPIAQKVIEDIDQVVEHLSLIENHSEPSVRRFKYRPKEFATILDYLFERRRFMIWLLKRTGLRPGEMEQMSASQNSEPTSGHALFLPTYKHRRNPAPIRKFPISIKDERCVMRYLFARDAWITYCTQNCETSQPSDAMFLSAEPGSYGVPISKNGLQKDFARLCDLAGYRDYQTCQSMFRHRFITYEILSLLKRWEDAKGSVMIDRDYRSILERVRVKTGHRSVESLFHYVDLARDIEGIWSEADMPSERLRALDHLRVEVGNLRRELRAGKSQLDDVDGFFDIVIERLTDIVGDAKSVLDTPKKRAS